jgi:hypothetical protein
MKNPGTGTMPPPIAGPNPDNRASYEHQLPVEPKTGDLYRFGRQRNVHGPDLTAIKKTTEYPKGCRGDSTQRGYDMFSLVPAKWAGKALLFAMLLGALGCTEQERVKNFGGTLERTLTKGEKLVMVTWKDDNLWILTRPMRSGETAETYTFLEQSSYGVAQGKVVIHEELAWVITERAR